MSLGPLLSRPFPSSLSPRFFPLPGMPLVLTVAEQEEAMKLGSAELKALMSRHKVNLVIQAMYYHSDVTTIAAFSNFAKDVDDLRLSLKDDFGIDATQSLARRSDVGSVISAFQSASTRRTEISRLNAELDARQMQKPVLGSEYLVLKAAFETLYGPHEDADLPSKSYLERRIADLESGDFRAEPLTSVLARDQEEDDSLIQSWDSAGNIRLRKATHSCDLPANPEDLRQRLTVLLNCLMMMALQHTNRSEVQNFRPTFVHEYTKYLLGEHVWQMIAKDNDGNTVVTPHWGLIIQYEQAIRKKAFRDTQETGVPLVTTIKNAWLDPLVKERSFTTPLALTTAAGTHINATSSAPKLKVTQHNLKDQQATASSGRVQGRGKGPGKGKGGKKQGKGKGRGGSNKGSGLTVPTGCAARTPDGRALCFGYNDQSVRCRLTTFPFLHVCGTCFAKGHPMYACRGQRAAPPAAAAAGSETAGAGI